MRIAYVITRADAVGGASIHVRDLARAMLERGHQPVVLVGGVGPVTEQLTLAGVPFHCLQSLRRSIHPARDVLAIRELEAVVRSLAPQLLSLHTAKAGWIGRVVAARLGIPAIYTPHGWPIGDRISPAAGIAFRFAEMAASGWAAAIICVCEAERRLALSKGVAKTGQLHVVYNGVRDVEAELRADAGGEPLRIISLARFEEPKDHSSLLRALATIRSHAWQLDLVGDGPREARMRVLAERLGVADRVRFLGYLADPAPALSQARIFVLSSRSEGFPRSVLEAMRAGLPVVASDVGGVPEAVASGENGLLVPRSDPQALATALVSLAADGQRRRCMGAEARRTYERRFTLERMVDETLAVYGTVIESSTPLRSLV